ncbi:flagellar protein FlaG [Desulfotomaculum copahuensis]|uniref:Flagellar protein FlaG n=1 Tax=Desulfotomaculum copahuensis TaxID=1838280 RepID=A0A1B7LCD7_9FIRM|nr:flagellar protein FlaG [Desulfotomaculum copahuensis]OAT80372.1 hypothetical protein A6M21_13470 [Desulfotomaculum copahuensis]
MKIGAGGLQALITSDSSITRKVEPVQPVRSVTDTKEQEQSAISAHQPAYQATDLNKAVAMLNKAAEMFNQPFAFQLDEKTQSVGVSERESGRPLTTLSADRTLAMMDHMQRAVGVVIDQYI